MNQYFFILLIVFGATFLIAFDDNAAKSPAVQAKYEQLVQSYMETQDKACRVSALQEAKLTLGGDTSDGEEESNIAPRFSKPKGTRD